MLELNTDKERIIEFEASLSGISPNDLSGHFRILVDGIEYGFPVNISESSIVASIPSLKNIVHRTLREGETFKSRLDVIGDDHYLNPWSGEIKVKSSIMVEAKLVNTESKKEKPLLKASIKPVITENKKPPEVKKVIKIDPKKITKEHFRKFMENHGTKDKRIQKVILENCINKVGDNDPKKLFYELFNYYKKD
jgi:hypothetical protein